MESIKKLINETIKEQRELIEKMKNEIETLPFYKFLEVDRVYKITYEDYMKEKIIIGKYKGIVTQSGILDIPQIKYIPLKKDLTEYEGRRGYVQTMVIEHILNIEVIK